MIRLPLRHLQRDDLPLLERLCTDTSVRAFLGGPIHPSKVRERCHRYLESTEEADHWVIQTHETEQSIGLLSVHRAHDGLNWELSYQLLPVYWGKGLAQAAIQELLSGEYLSDKIDVLFAETQTENLRSIKLLNTLGFKREREITRFGHAQSIFSKALKPSC